MSDVEEQQIVEEVAVEQQDAAITIEDALKVVLRTSLVHDGLARGLREASKALSRKEAQLCVLCDSVTEESIIKLVEALCNEGDEKIPLIKVSDAKLLGEWAGLCQLDREGNARKVVGCSCVVVKNWGADSEERNVLLEHFSQQIKYAVDDFSIRSPEKSPSGSPETHRNKLKRDSPDNFNIYTQPSPPDSKRAKLLDSLDSALTKPEDTDLPKLRRRSQSHTSKTAARKQYQEARELRKTAFSSDDDDDEKDFTPTPMMDYNEASQTPDYEEESETIVKKEPVSPKQPTEPVKRKRGRPRKGEQEKKSLTVTRRSKRIVENPDLQKHHTPEPVISLVPKPLRTLELGLQAYQTNVKPEPTATSITKSASGRQKPLVVDAERLHTSSTRDKRFTLTTLDVLRQLVNENNPKAMKNEIINESDVLQDFKAHLIYNINHLMDLHASVKDISHDVADVQRRKTEMRTKILELKKQHADVGEKLNRLRNEHNLHKEKQAHFDSTVDALDALKKATADPQAFEETTSISDSVLLRLADVARVYDPKSGLQEQLHIINRELAKALESTTSS
ncbi:hypothetical protein CAJCM15448_42020 [Candidozyma auris]|nr:hypothetical protein CAJCM15448_42020 [[Candida] auris]